MMAGLTVRRAIVILKLPDSEPIISAFGILIG